MNIEHDDDIVGLTHVGRLVANTLDLMIKSAAPGMTTAQLDEMAAAYFAKHDVTSAPILTYNFPGSTCISVNEEVAHGIPGSRILRDGDIVNIDVSGVCGGYFADTGGTFVLGTPKTPIAVPLLVAAQRARDEVIASIRPGMSLRHVAHVVKSIASESGFEIIRNLGSHGVGRALHEAPSFISSVDTPNERRRFTAGMVITIEPFLTTGAAYAYEADDGWTLLNTVGSLSAQFEHTFIITDDGPIITTLPG